MKLYVKNKLVSLKGSSSVVNDNNESVYNVQGKFFSPTRKKKICDKDGNVLYVVRNKWFHFIMPSTFICNANGEKLARVKKEAFTFKPKFIVEGYKDEISIDGEFFNATMRVLKNDVQIGTISREFTVFADSFCVEASQEEMPFMVALTIAIDNIYDKIRNERD